MFSEATELESNKPHFIASTIVVSRLSITPFVEKDILVEEIEHLLTDLEKKVQLSSEEIEPLSALISLYYYDDYKDEYEFRLNSLLDLYEVGEIIATLELREEVDPEEVHQLLSKVSTCCHGPYRSLLENKLNYFKNRLSKREIKEKDFFTIVKTTGSLDELDNALCELVVKEYINLGKEKRLMIGKELLKTNREKDSLEEISGKINRLIATTNSENSNIDTVTDVHFKDTIFVNELTTVRIY